MLRLASIACALLISCRPPASPAPPPASPPPASGATVEPPPPTPATPVAESSPPSPAASEIEPPPPTPATPTTEPGTKFVDLPAASKLGALDPDDIRNVVRSRIADVRACYNRGLVRDPQLSGRVSITFTIGSDGAVTAAVVESSTLPEAASGVANCIAAVSRFWAFPAPTGGGSVVVTYPFVLEPA